MAQIDFTDAPLDLSTKYGGSDQKRPIIYNGNRYMIKMSDRIPDEKRNPLNSSYSNSAISEHVCCKILASMGIPVQETILGVLTTVSTRTKEKVTHPVVACKNFLQPHEALIEFSVAENALLLGHKPGKTPRIEDIYNIILTDNQYFHGDFKEKAMARYWDTFILDAFLGNFDRHSNNWGYIADERTNKVVALAPIYDCGSCLYPQIADDAIPEILANKEQIQKRIDVYPKAALLLENGEKAVYKSYINSLENEDCNQAILRIAPLIDLNKIADVIDSIEGVPEIRKTFFKVMLTERYLQIIEPAYEKLIIRQITEQSTDNTAIKALDDMLDDYYDGEDIGE